MDAGTAAILGAIVGAVITGPVGYFFSKRLFEKQRFDNAATKYRSILVDELMNCPEQNAIEEGKIKELIGICKRIQSASYEFSFVVEVELRNYFMQEAKSLNDIRSQAHTGEDISEIWEKLTDTIYTLMWLSSKKDIPLYKKNLVKILNKISRMLKYYSS